MIDTVADHRSFYLVFQIVSKELDRIKRARNRCKLDFHLPYKVDPKHDSGGKAYRKEVIMKQLLGRDADICA
jgi:hypothetical protein